ncbi:MAG: RNA polymerase sigma factor [Chloroflexi bacterium]|nr:RNA polymerase sigma factor [Chloroflexota bacterium]MCI0827639.1 RNA polymerase sigma factor [Chloroflexota bacterium]MCI0861815.1 RNA polymerase sigma factor [Chloroflexota bacterium]
MVPDDERALITAAAGGDDDAFAEIVERYQKPLYNLCYRLLGSHGDAEDASQETFMKAYRALSKYDPERPFISWLLAIAYHRCIDQLRRRRLTWVGLEALFDRPDRRAPSPEVAAEAGEYAEDVQEALSTLSVKDRAVVVLRYWYDYSYDEIAETLSLTNSAVKSRLHRARRELMGVWKIDPVTLTESQNEVSPA